MLFVQKKKKNRVFADLIIAYAICSRKYKKNRVLVK